MARNCGLILRINTGSVVIWWTKAAIRSAALSVAINTRLMKDRDYAEKMNEELDALVAKYVPMAEEAFQLVYGGLR